jgi:hypothetical protein
VKSKATTAVAVEAVEPVAINGEEYRAMLELAKMLVGRLRNVWFLITNRIKNKTAINFV